MSFRNGKLQKILSYLNLQYGISLEKLKHKPIKTRQQFLENYQKHDKATKNIALIYFQNNFSLHPVGRDLREAEVFLNREVPDYFVEKIIDSDESISFCFDVKSKSKEKWFGWVNEKSIRDYQRFSEICEVDVYVIFLLIEDEENSINVAYADIFKEQVRNISSWDGNKVSVLPYKKGLPYLNEILF
jgi:hypothetical protein